MKNENVPKVAETTFVMSDDGRVYISNALVDDSTITKAQVKT